MQPCPALRDSQDELADQLAAQRSFGVEPAVVVAFERVATLADSDDAV